VVVSVAQPPVSPPVAPPITPPAPPKSLDPMPPVPPKPFPAAGVPTTPTPPPTSNETPLSKFEPLAAFPPTTQFAVRGVLLGSDWMVRMNQSNGRFLFGYLPALRRSMTGDHDLKQAQAALAMAQSAKFTGDQKQSAIANQAILTLLASTKIEDTQPKSRVPVHMSLVCNRVGFAATVALAIYELPNPSDKLIEDAEMLCAFLRSQLRADGSVHYTDGPNDVPMQIDPAGVNEYPGFALQALAMSNRFRPADWKKEAVKKGVAFYHAAFRAKPNPMMAATISPAATELYLQTKLTELTAAAFEMNDWLCQLQIPTTDPKCPQWAGGFRTMANGQMTDTPAGAVETGLYVQSLAYAYQLTRVTGDLTREGKYRPAMADSVNFLAALQFLETNTRHFENTFRVNMLLGAFHLSPTDGNLRIDATARAITGLLRFLSSGAERQ
ncbi:MAG: hypothetical protein L0241_30720, partial [Planctomycetia bacterium]|nr:hypothetical protein [Planctomycetia bacterium]